jgi:HlyD family secretion protein
MKSRKPILFVVLLILAVGGFLFWREYTRKNGAVPGTIAGNGTVEATEVEVSSKISGRILSLDVHEGDVVTQGQLAAVLDGGDLEGQVDQARGNLASAEATLAEIKAGSRTEDIRRLQAQLETGRDVLTQAQARRDLVRAGARVEQIDQIKAALEQAKVSLADAETELARSKKLEMEGAIPGRDLDQARTRRDLAFAQVEQARQRLAEIQAGARPEEIREAEAAVEAAASQVKAAQAALDLAVAGPRKETVEASRARVEAARGTQKTAEYLLAQTKVYVPGNGRVTLRSAEPGETVTPGMTLFRMADLRKVWIRVFIPETELGLVKLGQRAEVTSDSYPGKKFQGVVTEIAQKPEFTPKNVQTKEERVKLVFGVKVEVDNPDQELKPGMPADAVIFVAEGK